MQKIRSLLAVLCIAFLGAPALSWAQQITCQSRDYQQEFCATGGPIANAWMVVQRSQSPCIQGQTWGFQGNGIWVTQGCEADFGFQTVAGPPGGVFPGGPGGTTVTCESRNYQQQFCPTGRRISGASVANQRSSAACIQGQTWGYQGSDIWVTNGCAADFNVQGGGGFPVLPVNGNIVCESRNYQQAFCSTNRPISGAWLIAQRSRSACIQGRTWGYDSSGIWVTQGCEGEFGVE